MSAQSRLRALYARLMTQRTAQQPVALCSLDAADSGLCLGPAATACYALPAAQTLARQHFRQALPTALELERAIEVVEDLLAGWALHPTAQTRLLLMGEVAARLASRLPDGRRESVEALFQQLAELAEGSVLARTGWQLDAEGCAGLLMLRELMHHLGFAAFEPLR